jgi:hypothetical protein
MPPCIDIYAITNRRDLETINRFIDTYVDRTASEDRDDEQLMMLPLGKGAEIKSLNDYDWEPAKTLSNIVQRGLDHPRRSFTVYLVPSRPGINRVILSFTTDDQLVLGLSIDDATELPENSELAKQALFNLAREYNSHLGTIAVEQPPPKSEEDFLKDMKMAHTIYSQAFDS